MGKIKKLEGKGKEKEGSTSFEGIKVADSDQRGLPPLIPLHENPDLSLSEEDEEFQNSTNANNLSFDQALLKGEGVYQVEGHTDAYNNDRERVLIFGDEGMYRASLEAAVSHNQNETGKQFAFRMLRTLDEEYEEQIQAVWGQHLLNLSSNEILEAIVNGITATDPDPQKIRPNYICRLFEFEGQIYLDVMQFNIAYSSKLKGELKETIIPGTVSWRFNFVKNLGFKLIARNFSNPLLKELCLQEKVSLTDEKLHQARLLEIESPFKYFRQQAMKEIAKLMDHEANRYKFYRALFLKIIEAMNAFVYLQNEQTLKNIHVLKEELLADDIDDLKPLANCLEDMYRLYANQINLKQELLDSDSRFTQIPSYAEELLGLANELPYDSEHLTAYLNSLLAFALEDLFYPNGEIKEAFKDLTAAADFKTKREFLLHYFDLLLEKTFEQLEKKFDMQGDIKERILSFKEEPEVKDWFDQLTADENENKNDIDRNYITKVEENLLQAAEQDSLHAPLRDYITENALRRAGAQFEFGLRCASTNENATTSGEALLDQVLAASYKRKAPKIELARFTHATNQLLYESNEDNILKCEQAAEKLCSFSIGRAIKDLLTSFIKAINPLKKKTLTPALHSGFGVFKAAGRTARTEVVTYVQELAAASVKP